MHIKGDRAREKGVKVPKSGPLFGFFWWWFCPVVRFYFLVSVYF